MKAIRVWSRGADHSSTAAMRYRIDPPTLRDDLLEHLRASGCLAVKQGSDEIEAHLLNSVSDRHDREVLTGHLDSWKGTHPQARVDLISH